VEGMPAVQGQVLQAARRVVRVGVRVIAEEHRWQNPVLLVPVGGKKAALRLARAASHV
jgi:hypothetical protein